MAEIIHFDELDSTNIYAKNHCADLADKTIIVADVQTSGRGRMERKFISDKGGLYFSLILKNRHLAHLPNLTQLMALSVCKTLQGLGVNAFIKWPNDVYADGKKICGMLSEAVTNSQGPQALIIGVGVNVLQDNLQVGQPAVSLKMLDISVTPQQVLDHVLRFFFEEYDRVLTNGFTAIRDGYLQHFPYLGKAVQIKNGALDAAGTVQTISQDGLLVLQTPQGPMEISIGDMMV